MKRVILQSGAFIAATVIGALWGCSSDNSPASVEPSPALLSGSKEQTEHDHSEHMHGQTSYDTRPANHQSRPVATFSGVGDENLEADPPYPHFSLSFSFDERAVSGSMLVEHHEVGATIRWSAHTLLSGSEDLDEDGEVLIVDLYGEVIENTNPAWNGVKRVRLIFDNTAEQVTPDNLAIVDLFDVTDGDNYAHLIHCQPVSMRVNRYSDP